VAVLGLATAFTWGAVGTITALDRVDSYDRTAVPGQVTVSVTDPGPMVVYYELGRPGPLRRRDRHRPAGDSVQPGHRGHHRGALCGHHADLAAARADGDRT
jgi:hypothetical protein